MEESFKIKIAGVCGEIKTASSPTRTYLKSKFSHYISKHKGSDFVMEIDRNSASFPKTFVPCLSFKQGKFLILPEKNSNVRIGAINLKERCGHISDFKDKSKLFHSILLCFALFLENTGRIILHASAAFKNGSGYLFPGPANAGKSTILKQLKEISPLADEWVAVKKEKNGFSMWSIPYQDTPSKKEKIEKIFFPKKGKSVKSKRLRPQDAAKRLLDNCLFSTMHPDTVEGVLERTAELAETMSCYELEFPLNAWLDKELENSESPGEKTKSRGITNLEKGLNISELHESLILTWECNLSCHHCRPYLPQDGALSFDAVKKHLDTLVHKGSLFLHFTGGEPLVHKDFWKIASYARRRNFALILHTNGTLVTPEVSEKLKDLNFIQVSLTVLGEKARTHDSITGVEGSFEKTISALKILKEKTINVVLATTPLNENQDEISGIKKMAKNHGAAFTIIPYTAPKKGEFEEFSRCYLQNFQAS